MFGVKSPGLTGALHRKLLGLSAGEENGISGVAVKCVDIGRNAGGESGSLVEPEDFRYDTPDSLRTLYTQ